jgi:hypothetical protein
MVGGASINGDGRAFWGVEGGGSHEGKSRGMEESCQVLYAAKRNAIEQAPFPKSKAVPQGLKPVDSCVNVGPKDPTTNAKITRKDAGVKDSFAMFA